MRPLQSDVSVSTVEQQGPLKRIELQAPAIATGMQPGHFVTADLGEQVRTALLPSHLGEDEIGLLVPPGHPAAGLTPGERVNLLGPLGRPIRLPQPPGRLLLLADTTHLVALLPAATQSLQNGCATSLLLHATTASQLYPLELLPPELEIRLATDDGSAGQAATLLELLTKGGLESPLMWADQILIAADAALYHAISEALRSQRISPGDGFAQALLLPTIVCGVGACQGCAVRVRRSVRKACTDGPAFDLLELDTS
jgi:dihydroorotate dehydrogenase electron transfer subunit